MSVTLSEVFSHAVSLKNAVVAGEYVTALKHSVPIQDYVYDALLAQGFKVTAAEAKTCSDIATCLCECESILQNPPAHAQPTGKIGDGKILELVLKIIVALAPFFVQPTP